MVLRQNCQNNDNIIPRYKIPPGRHGKTECVGTVSMADIERLELLVD